MDQESGLFRDDEQRANQFDLVSRLADDLAHEIKNPLNAIVINLEVLRVRLRKGDTTEALERAAVIEEEARRLHLIVDRLLQLLRPDREEVPLALDRVLDELTPLVDALTRAARNEFSAQPVDPVFVAVPRDALKFAMLGLLTAVHERLGEGGGTLSMACRTGRDDVRLRIEAVGESAPSTPGDEYSRAVAMATAILRESGARVEPDGNAVTVVLRRALPTA